MVNVLIKYRKPIDLNTARKFIIEKKLQEEARTQFRVKVINFVTEALAKSHSQHLV